MQEVQAGLVSLHIHSINSMMRARACATTNCRLHVEHVDVVNISPNP